MIGSSCLVVLAFAVAACAQVRVAPQAVPRVWNYQAVHEAGVEIQSAAEHAHHAAAQRAVASDKAQVAAVADLAALADAAARFNQRIEPSHQESEYSRSEYEALLRAFRSASPSARQVQFGQLVSGDLDRIGTLLERVGTVYGPRWQYEQVAAIAGELEQSTAQLYRRAQDAGRIGVVGDERALFLLSRLAFSAAHYRRQIDLERDPWINYATFRLVLEDYARCSIALGAAGFDAQVRPDFIVAGRVLDELARAYLVPWSFAEVSEIAAQARAAAQRLNDAAATRSHAGRTEEVRAVQDIALLARATDRLVRQLLQAPENPGVTFPEFLQVAAGFERTATSFPQVQLGPGAGQDFQQLGLAVIRLRRIYASQREISLAPAQISGVPVGR